MLTLLKLFSNDEQSKSNTTSYDEYNYARKLWSKSESRLWTINLFAGTCALYASRVTLPICAAAIAQEYGWNRTDLGTVLSCFFWGYALTQVVAGGIADRTGGERVLSTTAVLWIALTFFTPQLFDIAYWSGSPLFVLLVVRVFTGVGQGFHLPCTASIVSRHLTATDKGRVFGIMLAGSHVGTVIAGVVGSVLLELFGWRSLFQAAGAMGLLWWVVLKQMLVTSFGASRRIADSDTGGLLMASEQTVANAEEISSHACVHDVKRPPASSAAGAASGASLNVPWRTLFQHPAFWAAWIAQYCGANAYYLLFSWLPTYFADNHPTAKGVSFNVIPGVAIVITSILAPFMASRLQSTGHTTTNTRKIMEGASLIGITACLVAVSAAGQFYTALMMFTCAMAFRGLHHGGIAVNPHDFAPNHTGAVFGIFNAASAITGFIGVYLAGFILQATGNNWSYVFMFTALQCIVGACVFTAYGTGNKII